MAPILLLPMIQVASTASFAFEIAYSSDAPIPILVSVSALFWRYQTSIEKYINFRY